ncbi:hypothetical protein Val02_71280 [Virgisporangium aliadipatigenens]|uniref:Aminoglycoside phosphotransferase domain-containing protein n=1 Tax=Virgisporangium aliadipatigenens TaxID=741659 RepID=A0A8J3YTL9_9ACTN|nr:aminoglycoside phosphotransferase family protein [Virgisporangium aliadipatigenens]GIJ50242.1 hypothetical protein Val02_71280 [Virgisporangium aliadipatigenens]
MSRTVTAIITHHGACLGALGPFTVDTPWWADMVPVVAHLEAALGVPVLVLRLLDVHGSDGARDGHVTYHVEAARAVSGLRAVAFVDEDHALRLPWARPEGIARLLEWAGEAVPVTGPAQQRRSWNLSGLFRLPTAGGPVWLKATPPFAHAEPLALAAVSTVDSTLVPPVLASAPGRLLLPEVPGVDCWDAPPPVVADAVRRLVTAQARVVPPPGLPDRRPGPLSIAVRGLLDGAAVPELSTVERSSAHRLVDRWETLDACGLPDTLVHGDFHPGNWRSDGGPPVVLDWADAHLGNPVLDGLRAIDYLPADRRAVAEEAWVRAWTDAAAGSRPREALRLAAPLAHLTYAVRYQEFLDNIEPSERVYHRGDPAAVIREALRAAGSE